LNSIEVSAKTIKEALAKGCAQLGCDPDDVEMQVIEIGSPGLFGLFGKPAKVKLTLKSRDDDLSIDIPTLSLDNVGKAKKQAEPRKEKPKAEKKPEAPKPEKKQEKKQPEKKAEKKPEPVEPAAQDEPAAPEAEAAEKPAKSRRRRNRKPRGEAAAPAEERVVETIPAPLPEPEPFVVTPEEELSDIAKKARTFLSGLVERMNVPAQIEVCDNTSAEQPQVRMNLSGENMSILIGRRGETLDALQYLTSLNVNMDREDYVRISLDTEDYRARREEALTKLAVRMANRCKKTGKRVALEPMNPYERRILHSALQADPEVTTHSEGEEPFRRVIITLK